jgi:hypothetical protein
VPRTVNGTGLGRGAEATDEAAEYEQLLPRFAHKTLPGAPSGAEVTEVTEQRECTLGDARRAPLSRVAWGTIWMGPERRLEYSTRKIVHRARRLSSGRRYSYRTGSLTNSSPPAASHDLTASMSPSRTALTTSAAKSPPLCAGIICISGARFICTEGSFKLSGPGFSVASGKCARRSPYARLPLTRYASGL